MNKKKGRKSDKLAYAIAWTIMSLFVLTALLAPLLATDQPYYARKGNNSEFTFIKKSNKYVTVDDIYNSDQLWLAPVPFRHQGYTRLEERLKPPGTQVKRGNVILNHYLGTDRLGRDVAAGIIFGFRKSLGIGIFSMLVAAIVGISLGASAGYWGNALPVHLSWPSLLFFILCIYFIYLLSYSLISLWVGLAVLIGLITTTYFLNKNKEKKYFIPLDLIVLKLIEVFQSIPALLLLLVVAAFISSPTLITLSLLIASIRWTSFARYARAEFMKISARDYITAAKVSGLSNRKIIMHYILPETWAPLVVVFAFGVSSVVLLESTLSFLGIGIPVDEVTWGTLLAQARQHTSAWWLTLFPGVCIMLMVFSLNLIGSQLKEKFDAQD